VYVYGASWEEEIPVPSKVERGANVLLIHAMMVGEEKVWEGQEGFTQARNFLREHPYDLIVSGDNHQQFHYTTPSGKALVNPGSVMRARIDQADHVPALYVYDTIDRTLERFPLPMSLAEEVLDLDKVEVIKGRDEKIEAFVESLTVDVDVTDMNFRNNLKAFLAANNIDKPVKEIIYQCLPCAI
jgi:hypothetical protein